MRAEVASYSWLVAGKRRVFVQKTEPPKQQSFIQVSDSLTDAKRLRTLVDPNLIDPSGKVAIEWFVPSPDDRYLAVCLAKQGTESGDVHVFDVDAGKEAFEVVPRVNGGTAGGDLAWRPDSKGFYYTRYPRPGERPKEDLDFYQHIYFHTLNTDTAKDEYIFGKDLPKIAEVRLDVDEASGRLLIAVQNGDGGQFAHYLKAPGGVVRTLSDFADEIVQALFGPGDDLLLVSRKNAPNGKVLRRSGRTLSPKTDRVIVPETNESIVSDFWGSRTLLKTKKGLYVTRQLGGPTRVDFMPFYGSAVTSIPTPETVSLRGLARFGGGVLYRVDSFLEPTLWMYFDEKSGAPTRTIFASESPVHVDGARVLREVATSQDGTRVPVNILLPPSVSPPGPCIATGYGGYGISLEPRFRPEVAYALEQGIVYAVANLRGGSEFGEKWHEAGRLTHKQNVFDDFFAALNHVVSRGYTTSSRTGIIGGSNGGLLMGATLVQHPNAAAAVVSLVGIYDMLRAERSPNGAFNVTEFGTVADRAQFEALYAYSPYHHVQAGVTYPPTLLLTGENDPRVDPMQSRKMAARLQAANSLALLRTSAGAGHGGTHSLDERTAQTVDAYSFLFHHLGVRPR
jgi:prolyl oligopeptidase